MSPTIIWGTTAPSYHVSCHHAHRCNIEHVRRFCVFWCILCTYGLELGLISWSLKLTESKSACIWRTQAGNVKQRQGTLTVALICETTKANSASYKCRASRRMWLEIEVAALTTQLSLSVSVSKRTLSWYISSKVMFDPVSPRLPQLPKLKNKAGSEKSNATII